MAPAELVTRFTRPTLPAGVLAATPPPSGVSKTLHKEYPWSWSAGDPDAFSASLSAKAVLDGKVLSAPTGSQVSEMTFGANGAGGGAILGQDFSLLDLSARFHAPLNASTPMNAQYEVKTLGATVYNFNENFTTNWSHSDTLSKSVKVAVPFGIPLGPIWFGGELGAKGEIGFEYGIELSRSQELLIGATVTGHIGPFVHTSVYGEGGPSILIGGAGIGAKLDLLDGTVRLYGTAGFLCGAKCVLVDDLYADYELKMLAGEVYAYVYVYYPCPKWTDPFDTCKKQWEHAFWDWEGLHESGVLLDEKHQQIL
jgi:hypothetical protein